MSVNIYDLANELERAIRNLPEYKAVAEMKERVAEHLEAQAILNDYAEFQKEIQQQLQVGHIPNKDSQKKMLEFNQKIQEYPILLEYFGKQQQLATYVADLERIIFQPLNDLL